MKTHWLLLLILLALECAAPAARAESLIVSVSNTRVTVTPNYDGEELVLFGSVERDDNTPSRATYDIVVTVRGPRGDMVTRRKERVLGIWINRDSREFVSVPSYLGIFSNRPADMMASPDTQRRLQLGMANISLIQHVGIDYADVVTSDPFRSAFIRLQTEHGLYREDPEAVTFLTPRLFRTSIPLPAEVPIGPYSVEIQLLSDSVLITRTETSFEIVKVGFEQFVASSARRHGLWYGLATALMALTVGWLGSVIFRRD
ncbi:MAG: TIGR02186 family protein [Xanthobacteraceae bacterium]|nr:TIGR02186 family protein [Xanthobacteraceae bacterium]